MLADFAAISKGDFSTPPAWGVREDVGVRGWAHSIAPTWVPISSLLTHMAYLLPVLSYLAGSKIVSVHPGVRPGYDDKYRSRGYSFVVRQ